MSRAYRIAVKESLRRHVRVEDGVNSKLELLPILEPGRMGGLVAAELERRGFTREGDVVRRTGADGVVVEVHLGTGEVSVRAQAERELALEQQREVNVTQPDQGARAELALRASTRESLETEATAQTKRLREEATARVEAALRGLRGELDEAVNRVTAEALKVRAAELGEVEEVREEPGGGLTIRVRV